MESLTIKQLEAMCAAFELAFGEDADFMVWLEEQSKRHSPAQTRAWTAREVCNEI